MIVIFHFGLGERRLILRTPQDGLQALVHATAFDEVPKSTDDRGFVGRGHRQIRLPPITEYAESLELFSLNPDVLLRVRATPLSNARHIQIFFLLPKLLHDLMFDGETMTVPARYVGSMKPRHRL